MTFEAIREIEMELARDQADLEQAIQNGRNFQQTVLLVDITLLLSAYRSVPKFRVFRIGFSRVGFA